MISIWKTVTGNYTSFIALTATELIELAKNNRVLIERQYDKGFIVDSLPVNINTLPNIGNFITLIYGDDITIIAKVKYRTLMYNKELSGIRLIVDFISDDSSRYQDVKCGNHKYSKL